MARRRVRTIDLDEIPELKGRKRADVLIEYDDGTFVIIEETKIPKKKDVDKLIETLKFFRGQGRTSKALCLLHFRRKESSGNLMQLLRR